jgi:membrane-anchored protein YejM (alkaline phosphatase superfamily)
MTILISLLGRFLFAYVLVWLACLVYSKFNLKRAAARTHSQHGLISVSIVFLIPLLAALGSHV